MIEIDKILSSAATRGELEEVKAALEEGANINIKSESGFTPLMVVCCFNHSDIARFLIEKGADLEIKAKEGITALMFASYNGNLEIVKLLIEKGANLNEKNDQGEDALMIAAKERNLEVFKFLESQKKSQKFSKHHFSD